MLDPVHESLSLWAASQPAPAAESVTLVGQQAVRATVLGAGLIGGVIAFFL